MIILETVKQSRKLDIGKLDHILRLPTSARIKANMKTVCKACGKSVVDEYFIAGFKKGLPNMIFHEHCLTDKDKP